MYERVSLRILYLYNRLEIPREIQASRVKLLILHGVEISKDYFHNISYQCSYDVNFERYPYGGYLPKRPSTSRRLIPEMGTPDYEELKSDPDKAYLKTITSQLQSVLKISLVEILSMHSSNQIFLGQRDSPEWTTYAEAVQAFEMFGKRLSEIEKIIIDMNNDGRWKNRYGPVNMPYTLLYFSSEIGLTGRDILNSVSI